MTEEHLHYSKSAFDTITRGVENGKIKISPTHQGYAEIKIDYRTEDGEKISKTFTEKGIDDAATLVGIQGNFDAKQNKILQRSSGK